MESNARNIYVDCIWFHIKQKMMKDLTKDINFVCVFVLIYAITLYHYIATNKVLLNKIFYINIDFVTKPPRTFDNSFSFKEYFIRKVKLNICIV